MKKKIVIFDLDGTLLDTLEDLTDSVNFMLKKFNYPLKSLPQVRDFLGNGVSVLIKKSLPECITEVEYNNCIQEFKNHYNLNKYNKTAPYHNIIPMLKYLKNNNYIVAVVSNKFDIAVKELCEKYFGDLIDMALGENEAEGIRRKPYPDSVLKILQEYNISKSEALYSGDSEVDIQTAKNCGIDCVSVTWGFKSKDFLLKSGARNLIDTPMEILKYC